MKLTALTLLLAALVVAAPAWAQSPEPSVVAFTSPMSTPITVGDVTINGECGGSTFGSGGRDGGGYLQLRCGYPYMTFARPQALVELYARGAATFRACAGESCTIATQTVSSDQWTPVILEGPGIEYVDAVPLTSSQELDIDDLTFSPTADQPDTTITSEASALRFAINHPLGGSFLCGFDGAALASCSNPVGLSPFAPGPHSVRAAAVDIYGRTDPTAAALGFTIPETVVDGDRDGVPDASDNCPADANTDQSDADKDGVGNACEELPSGNTPPTAGVTAVVRQLSGEVFVKLPGRSLMQETGFIPLKGVAAIPIGSTVDARKGEIEVASAANGYAASNRRAKRQQARIKAGMFVVRQKRAKRNAAKKTAIGTDVALLSPPGAETQCRASGGPPKGVVRSVSMVVKGLYRAIGGATTATAKSATFATTDRCDGTLTEVGKGRVTVAVKGRKKPVVVRGGGAYFVKAKLFAARKGKRPLRD